MDIQEFAFTHTNKCMHNDKIEEEEAWPMYWRKPTIGGPIHPGFRANTQGLKVTGE